MKIIVLFLTLYGIWLFNLSCGTEITVEGYYWREFAGKIPSDAFPAGQDRNGQPIYVGQVLHDKYMMPAKIYKNDPKAYYPIARFEQATTENIKILCTQHPERFKWVQTSTSEIRLLTNFHLILGGYDPSNTVYIGRLLHEQETTIGKVMVGKRGNDWDGIYIPSKGKEIWFKSYEVLAYEPKDDNVVDVRFSDVDSV